MYSSKELSPAAAAQNVTHNISVLQNKTMAEKWSSGKVVELQKMLS